MSITVGLFNITTSSGMSLTNIINAQCSSFQDLPRTCCQIKRLELVINLRYAIGLALRSRKMTRMKANHRREKKTDLNYANSYFYASQYIHNNIILTIEKKKKKEAKLFLKSYLPLKICNRSCILYFVIFLHLNYLL